MALVADTARPLLLRLRQEAASADADDSRIVVVLPGPVFEERPDQLAKRLRVGRAEADQVADLVVKVAVPLPDAPVPRSQRRGINSAVQSIQPPPPRRIAQIRPRWREPMIKCKLPFPAGFNQSCSCQTGQPDAAHGRGERSGGRVCAPDVGVGPDVVEAGQDRRLPLLKEMDAHQNVAVARERAAVCIVHLASQTFSRSIRLTRPPLCCQQLPAQTRRTGRKLGNKRAPSSPCGKCWQAEHRLNRNHSSHACVHMLRGSAAAKAFYRLPHLSALRPVLHDENQLREPAVDGAVVGQQLGVNDRQRVIQCDIDLRINSATAVQLCYKSRWRSVIIDTSDSTRCGITKPICLNIQT